MSNPATQASPHLALGDRHVADEMVPRVSTLIAKGALLQDRRLQVSETGEVRWVSTAPAVPTLDSLDDGVV